MELFTSLLQGNCITPMYIDSVDGLNSPHSSGIDIMMPASQEGLYGQLMKNGVGQGIRAVSFRVDDLPEATRCGEAGGLRILSQIGYPGIEDQTQFNPEDFYGLTIELAYLYPGHEQMLLDLNNERAKQEGLETCYIDGKPGSLACSGIHHARMRVRDLEGAMANFSRAFDCEWEVRASGTAACASTGLHLLQTDGRECVDAVGLKVEDIAAAKARVAELGLRQAAVPEYLSDESCICLDAAECFGVSLVLVEETSSLV